MDAIYKPFKTTNGYYVYDRNINSVLSINKKEYEILFQMYLGNNTQEGFDLIKCFNKEGYLLPNNLEKIFHGLTDYYSSIVERKMSKLILQVTQNCNLRCSYCVYTANYNNRRHSNLKMSKATAFKAIDFLFSHSSESEEVGLGFYGGEPLLEFDLIKSCVNYINSCYSEKNVNYSITTNGTLLDLATCRYLQENNFSITVSFDGPEEIHNRCRKFPNGEGSYQKVLHNLEGIAHFYKGQSERIKVLINTVVSPESDFSTIVDFYNNNKNLNMFWPRFDLVSDEGIDKPVIYNDSFYIRNSIEELKCILNNLGLLDNSYVSKLYLNEKTKLVNSINSFSKVNGFPSRAHPSGTCIPGYKRLLCTCNGSLYPCEKINEKSKVTCIGNIDDGIDIHQAKKLMNLAQVNNSSCKKCWAFLHCSLCVVTADDGEKISLDLIQKRCEQTKNLFVKKLKTYCFYQEHNLDINHLGDNT